MIPTPAKKTDSDIQHDVACELAWDAGIAANEIGIQVQNGVVTFTGTVDSWAKLRAAQDAAHRVAGVLDVANDLVVRPIGSAARTDTEIARAVRQALEWDVLVPDHQITSTVAHGTVALEGAVSRWQQRSDAERAIERLAGVKRVLNRIEITPTETVNLDRARQAVDRALERHAAREARRIQLDASESTVSVAGIVHTLDEKEAVLGAVRGTRGVRDVRDHLRVEPHR
ncbi:MAG TPA: BON domain-containing protein [Polyangia bacterium]|nr:BON domain-containing protein [Polyangia bacterium]